MERASRQLKVADQPQLCGLQAVGKRDPAASSIAHALFEEAEPEFRTERGLLMWQCLLLSNLFGMNRDTIDRLILDSQTPAMAAGITDRPLQLVELLG